MTSAAASDPPQRRLSSWFHRFRPAAANAGDIAGLARHLGPFVPPSALLVTAILVACGTLALVVTHYMAEGERQAQRDQVLGAISASRTMLAEVTQHLAADAAPSAPDRTPRLNPAGFSQHRLSAAYLAGADGRVLAGHPDEGVPPAVIRLIAAFRTSVADRAGPTSAAATDFVLIGGRPSVAAVAVVNASEPTGINRQSTLATVMPLDASLAGLFEGAIGVNGLRVDADPPDYGRVMHSLLDQRGRIVGWVSWDPDRPVAAAAWRVLPFAGLLAACLVVFAIVAIRIARRAQPIVRGVSEFDPLTKVANRARTLEVLDRALAARHPEQTIMLAFIDLDNFEDVNDTYGHRGGDALLASIAQRLRESLPPAAMVGRVGGNEFAIVLTADSAVSAVDVANAAHNALAKPFEIGGQAAHISACVGIALAPRDGESRDEIMRRADLALRAAKRHGRGSIVAFELPLEQAFHDRRFIMRGLRRALAEDGLSVRYQPILTADTQRVVGVEALLRWRHRTRGEIPPEVFVPIAEQSGLMGQLGEFVLRRALADAARWKNLYVAINVSPVQMRDPGLVDLVAGVLRQTGTPSSRVVFEITENVLIDDPEKAVKRLEKLRSLGVRIALDDFGSGYSSLRYLQRFPIDKLKIDKSFVARLGESGDGGVIIHAIIALGRALGLSVLVEGVETETQRTMVRLAGCDEVQGHLFAKPLPASDIDLINHRAGARRELHAAAGR